MSEKIYDVSADWAKRAWVDGAKYREMYARSVADPNGFWAEHGKRIGWMKPFSKVENVSFAPGNISIKWFEDGVLNVAWNCIDRHLAKRGDQTAIIWEGDNPSESKHITYRQLHDEVCKFANILRTRNVKKGDRVTIYLPMIPEAAYAMLACARIGAIHSVVFAGFSPDSLAQRITDCQSRIVITADEGLRGGKKVPLKANVDAALEKTGDVDWVIVVKRTGAAVDMKLSRDLWYHEAAKVVTLTHSGLTDEAARTMEGPYRERSERVTGALQKLIDITSGSTRGSGEFQRSRLLAAVSSERRPRF